MRLQFLGAAGIVTGSCFLLETANARVMVECGMYQGRKEIRERNYESFKISPRDVDYVLLTHAHIDHSGLIPKLIKYGFNGKVYATVPTVELCEVLLPDSAYIQEMEVERKNRKNRRAGRPLIEPMYTVNEAYKCLSQFKAVTYNETIRLTPDIRVRFVDAGHILGSAMIEVCVRENDSETKLVFSGDIGNKNRPIVKDPSYIDEADYVIMESTYGARLHDQKEKEIESLHSVIWETYNKGGNLIIPAFAVERTQDLLYHLYLLMKSKRMPAMSIYIDSPLATAATEIFWKNHDVFDEEASGLIQKGEDPLQIAGIKFTKTAEESKALNQADRSIIISASGMCEAGRIRHHLKYNLWRPESTVLFVGYQADGSLGRQILDGQKTVKIFGDEIAVKAGIKFIESYSAHADQTGLVEWVKNFKKPPRETFLVHGEPESSAALADLLRSHGLKVTVPVLQQVVELLPEGAGAVPEDNIKTLSDSISSRLQGLLDSGIDSASREEILRGLAELENIINKAK